MTINLMAPDIRELKPRITVFGVGGAGGNAVNNMIDCGLAGVDFVVANTDAQALMLSRAERRIQMGIAVTEGLGAGSQPEVGRSAAEEVIDEIRDQLANAHMVFITAGMGGGTGTGAAPVVARAARESGILTVGVVTKPFHFEGQRRMRVAEAGIAELQKHVDTLIVIPNQNLFRIANEKTTFSEAFSMADQVLYSGVASITDLIVKPGLINLDFADVRAVMRDMGKAMMGTGEATGEQRAIQAAEAAIANPLLDEVSMKGARGLLISITGGRDMKIYEVDEAANRIREEVDQDANVIFGATQDDSLESIIRVSVVATGLDKIDTEALAAANDQRLVAMAERLRAQAAAQAAVRAAAPAPVLTTARAPEPVAPAPEPMVVAPAYVEPELVVQPVAPRAPVFEDVALQPEPAAVAEEEDRPAVFIPPQAERAPLRAQRMPTIDDLPLPGQSLVRARAEISAAPAAPEAKRMTLMQRLASVGLGRKDDEAGVVPPAPVAPLAPSPAHAEYARRTPGLAPRAAAGQLDATGRPPAPTARSLDDEQLEIPAFLRRQSN